LGDKAGKFRSRRHFIQIIFIFFVIFIFIYPSNAVKINKNLQSTNSSLIADLKIRQSGESWIDDSLDSSLGTTIDFRINCQTTIEYLAIAVKVELPCFGKNPMFEYDWGILGLGSSEPKPIFPFGDWSANNTDVFWAWYNINDDSWSKEMTFIAKIVKSGTETIKLRVIGVKDIQGNSDECSDSVEIQAKSSRSKTVINQKSYHNHLEININDDRANVLLEQFYNLEKNYNGIEKIKKQIQIIGELEETKNLNSIEYFTKIIEKIDTKNINFGKKRIFIGPTLISHFIPFGSIKGSNFNKSWYYKHSITNLSGIFNETALDTTIGAFPIFFGRTSDSVFITAINLINKNQYNRLYLNFIEFLSPCVGFSIRFIEQNYEEKDNIYFEYNLDLCFFAILLGLSF
jgi:hypothetical protein